VEPRKLTACVTILRQCELLLEDAFNLGIHLSGEHHGDHLVIPINDHSGYSKVAGLFRSIKMSKPGGAVTGARRAAIASTCFANERYGTGNARRRARSVQRAVRVDCVRLRSKQNSSNELNFFAHFCLTWEIRSTNYRQPISLKQIIHNSLPVAARLV